MRAFSLAATAVGASGEIAKLRLEPERAFLMTKIVISEIPAEKATAWKSRWRAFRREVARVLIRLRLWTFAGLVVPAPEEHGYLTDLRVGGESTLPAGARLPIAAFSDALGSGAVTHVVAPKQPIEIGLEFARAGVIHVLLLGYEA